MPPPPDAPDAPADEQPQRVAAAFGARVCVWDVRAGAVATELVTTQATASEVQ
jgi:hypothetical protein